MLDVTMHWAMSNPTAYPQDVAFFRAIIELHKEQRPATCRQRAHRPVLARS